MSCPSRRVENRFHQRMILRAGVSASTALANLGELRRASSVIAQGTRVALRLKPGSQAANYQALLGYIRSTIAKIPCRLIVAGPEGNETVFEQGWLTVADDVQFEAESRKSRPAYMSWLDRRGVREWPIEYGLRTVETGSLPHGLGSYRVILAPYDLDGESALVSLPIKLGSPSSEFVLPDSDGSAKSYPHGTYQAPNISLSWRGTRTKF